MQKKKNYSIFINNNFNYVNSISELDNLISPSSVNLLFELCKKIKKTIFFVFKLKINF